MILPERPRVPRLPRALLFVALAACKGGDDDDGGSSGDVTGGTASSFGHSASDPSLGSMTFTNSSDPTDPTDISASATDPSDPSSPTDATATATTGSPGSSDTSGAVDTTTDPSVGESSTGVDPTGESDTNGGGACCEAQDVAGCGDASIEACVCAEEPFCCDVQWDVVCTVQSVLLGCTTCPGIGGGGDCCAAHGNPGCDDDQVEQCVCNEDYVCCVDPWDDICVGIAMDTCAAC